MGRSGETAGRQGGIQLIVATRVGCKFRLVVSYETIRRRHGGDDEPPRLIVRRGKLVMALCVRADLNPRIFAHPPEVWLEPADYMDEWSDRLANDTGAVLLYVSSGAGVEYRARGLYHVLGSTDDPVELACRMAHPAVDRVARIIFLSGPHWR